MSKAVRLANFLKGSIKKKEDPNVVNFDITSKCNLFCEHCYWRKSCNPEKELSDGEWNKIFLDFHKKGVKSVMLTGGEPSMRPEVIRSAYQIFNNLTVVSNGTIPIPEDIQVRLFISLDGPAEIHNKIRGRKVFDTVIKNIQGDKRVVLTPTLSTTNYQYIDELVNIARDSDVDGITFSTYASHHVQNDPLFLRGEELEWTVKQLTESWRSNKDIVLLSPGIIKLFKSKKFYKTCYLRNEKNVVSYNAQLQRKAPCVLGEGIDCSSCGCIVPVIAYAMTRIDIRAWLVFNRLYPERYYG